MPRYRESVSWTDNPTAAAYFTIRGRVERFLRDAEDDWRAIANDPGSYGAGLCWHASKDLTTAIGGHVRWLARFGDLAAGTVTADRRYPGEALATKRHNHHAVALVGRWVVDLTARQFDPDLPFPFYWRPT